MDPGKVIISQSIYDFLIGDPNIILFCIDLLGKRLFLCKKNPEDFSSKCGYWESWGFFCSAPQDFGVLGVFYARVPPREASY